ncbi:MAG: inorganic diphosphatase [Polyangiaceae bacterium]
MASKSPWSDIPLRPAPGLIHVVVESPRGSQAKFKYDQELGVFRLNRLLPNDAVFPFDFGFIPGTLGEDRDPIDAILLLETPTFAGCVVRARPVGVLRATKEGKRNDRILAVATLSKVYGPIKDLKDIPREWLNAVERFYRAVLKVDEGEHEIGDFEGAGSAKRLIKAGAGKKGRRVTTKRAQRK